MDTELFCGIDPGGSGAIAVVTHCGEVEWDACVRLKQSDADVAEWLRERAPRIRLALVERVGAMPKQGVTSTWKFGRSAGFVEGLVTAYQIPWERIQPVKWQTQMCCRSGGDKNVTKAAAQRLFPTVKIVHANADALLLAELARRTCVARGLIARNTEWGIE